MPEISLNSACRRDIRLVGNEKTPVITIDDPVVSTTALAAFAASEADFGVGSQSAYPGIRAELPEDYVRTLVPELVALIAHQYKPPAGHRPILIHRFFSLVTRQPEELELLQRMPHTDNRSPFYFATVHYLAAGEHGGTGFFRHRPTGYERITDERYESYKQAAGSHMDANGPPAGKYIDATDDQFELIGEVGYRMNRMAIYPGNLLHSGLIRPDRDIDDDPASGRLTANLFLLFAPA